MKNNWQTAFSKMTYGIYVLTCRHDDTINGMIASWATQVSYEPPLILAAIHPNRYTHKLLESTEVFALHVLEKSQKSFLKRFKGPVAQEKFSGIKWNSKKTGAPVLDDCMAWFELEKIQTLKPGNHTLFIGKTVNAGEGSHRASGTPLCTLDYDGVYIGKT